jgi:hypothetical protein
VSHGEQRCCCYYTYSVFIERRKQKGEDKYSIFFKHTIVYEILPLGESQWQPIKHQNKNSTEIKELFNN